MKIKAYALKVEVDDVYLPEKFNYEKDIFVVSYSNISCYSRPEIDNHILIGTGDLECDERIFVYQDN